MVQDSCGRNRIGRRSRAGLTQTSWRAATVLSMMTAFDMVPELPQKAAPNYQRLESFWRILPNGRIQDPRCRFGHDDRVRITSGRYEGHLGTVESCVFDWSADYPEERAPGYHVKLDDWTWTTIRWDQVIRAS